MESKYYTRLYVDGNRRAFSNAMIHVHEKEISKVIDLNIDLATFIWNTDKIKGVITSIIPSIEFVNKVPYLCFTCRHENPLSEFHRRALSEYLEGQLSDGWFEGGCIGVIPYGSKHRSVFIQTDDFVFRGNDIDTTDDFQPLP